MREVDTYIRLEFRELLVLICDILLELSVLLAQPRLLVDLLSLRLPPRQDHCLLLLLPFLQHWSRGSCDLYLNFLLCCFSFVDLCPSLDLDLIVNLVVEYRKLSRIFAVSEVVEVHLVGRKRPEVSKEKSFEIGACSCSFRLTLSVVVGSKGTEQPSDLVGGSLKFSSVRFELGEVEFGL